MAFMNMPVSALLDPATHIPADEDDRAFNVRVAG